MKVSVAVLVLGLFCLPQVGRPVICHAAALSDYALPQGVPRSMGAGIGPQLQSFERRLSLGTGQLLKSMRWFFRRLAHIGVYAVRQWADWSMQGLLFGLLVLLSPLLDPGLIRTWRAQGFTAFRTSLVLMLAVFLRLIFDVRVPAIGKVLLLFAIVYGVADSDLWPDRFGVLALTDDCVVVALAYQCFIRLCPDLIVEEHAVQAGQIWNRILRRREGYRQIVSADSGNAVGR